MGKELLKSVCFQRVKQAINNYFKSGSLRQQGNIFLALFAAVGLLGLLGATAVTFVKGPLSSSVNVSRLSMSETQLMVVAQMITLDSVADADEGDCDQDGYVEPTEWKVPANALNAPINGGNIPDKISATKTDPWGTVIGYCSWNAGTQNTTGAVGACNEDGVASEQRLNGSPTPVYPSIAVVSAGPDKIFDTTCNHFIDGDADTVPDNEMVSKTSGSDDIILTYTYREAAATGGELWALESDDSTTATIGRNLNVTGGVIMGTQDGIASCGASDINSLRYNTMTNKIQACDGLGGWDDISGGGGITASSLLEDTGTSTCGLVDDDADGVPDDAGKIRYNTSINAVEICYPNEWRRLDVGGSSSAVQLVLSPASGSALDVTGPCSSDCPVEYGSVEIFTLTNIGGAATGLLSTSKGDYFTGTDADSFTLADASTTCDDGVFLAPGESCQLGVQAVRQENGPYSANLLVTDAGSGETATATLSGTSSGFPSTWIQISAADKHNCAVYSDDTGWCWGVNDYGEFGNGTTTDSDSPVEISGSASWSMLSTSSNHTCGIKTDGSLWCWGYASAGKLGNGDTSSVVYNTPQPIASGEEWSMVSASVNHTCGIKTDDGSLWCWGAGSRGQLGDGLGTTFQSTPVEVDGSDSWSVVSTGDQYTCGIKTDGTGWCWGLDDDQQLGNGVGDTWQMTPSPIAGGGFWKQTQGAITAGRDQTCGIKIDGSGYCWGDDTYGQLGNGATTGVQHSPQPISGGGTWETISAGRFFSCGVKTGGNGYCWGREVVGELGNGAITGDQDSPSALDDGGSSWNFIAAGGGHSCGTKIEGTAWCWGRDSEGQLGNGSVTTATQESPVEVSDP